MSRQRIKYYSNPTIISPFPLPKSIVKLLFLLMEKNQDTNVSHLSLSTTHYFPLCSIAHHVHAFSTHTANSRKNAQMVKYFINFFFQYFCVFSGNNSSVALSSQIIFLALQKCSKQCSLMRYVAILNQCGIFLSRFCYRQESFNQISGLHSIKILNCNIWTFELHL